MSASTLVGLFTLVSLLALGLYREGPSALGVAAALLFVPCLVHSVGFSMFPALDEWIGWDASRSSLRFASVIAATFVVAYLAPRCSLLGGVLAGIFAALSRLTEGNSFRPSPPLASPESGALVALGAVLGTALFALDRWRSVRSLGRDSGPVVVVETKRDP